ncbi:MAG: 16S rRNA (cytosine(1402)-N(4))-methyltransferase RsmH [Pseudomonadota bacterium]|nr:16S rRNA (cytosine(1402)-N(4))-methyltransferase RsmH [Pseudomonadota bacterium]
MAAALQTPSPYSHVPVLCAEVVEAMAPAAGKVLVDATFGAGGYSRALLNAAPCQVFGIDRDPRAIPLGHALADQFPGRFTLLHGPFSRMESLLATQGITAVGGICFDLGISSPQIDDPQRGFSFRHEGPLDMRMAQEGPTAADLVNTLPEQDLAKIIQDLGEDRMARRIARAIVNERATAPIITTGRLASIVRSVVPRSKNGIDPATRTFQALRIQVNDELGELEKALSAAARLLKPGGRLAAVSFHSLEDRTVKEFMRRHGGQDSAPSRHAPPHPEQGQPPLFRTLTRKPVEPSPAETAANPRARSARLRVAVRTDSPFPSEGRTP